MKFSGVTILQGVEFSIFPIDFEWALQQCSATALPVIQSIARDWANVELLVSKVVSTICHVLIVGLVTATASMVRYDTVDFRALRS